jgi:hypothetical protein
MCFLGIIVVKVYDGGYTTLASKKGKKRDIVQVKNSKTGKYVKIDRAAGKIIAHKKSSGPYQGVPVIRKKSR